MTREELRDYVELQRSLNNIPYHVYSALIDGIDTLEQEPTTKNDLAVDCISREQAKSAIRDKFKDLPSRVEINTILNELPSVTPQEPADKIFTKADLDSMAKAINYGWELRVNEVLDNIRAEIVDLGQRTMNDNRASGIWACRDIIDKYKSESEDKK